VTFLSLPAGAVARPTILGLAVAVDLRAVLPSALFADAMQASLAAGAGTFAWDSASVVADDGVNVIKPNDIAPVDPGRWLRLPPPVVPAGAGDLHFALSGVYSGAVTPGFFDPPYRCTTGFTVSSVELFRRTAGSGSSTVIDVLKNGASIFLAPGNRPTVIFGAGDYASNTSAVFAPGANIYAPGDVLEVRLDSVEAYLAAATPGPEGIRVVVSR